MRTCKLVAYLRCITHESQSQDPITITSSIDLDRKNNSIETEQPRTPQSAESMLSPMTAVEQTLMTRWLRDSKTDVGQHSVMVLTENCGARAQVAEELNGTFRSHYMSPEAWSDRISQLGAPETAQLLQELLPKTKQSRSGDTGEILATQVAEEKLNYRVPIRRLRWKDGRDAALRGDDIVGVISLPGGQLRFLKGESKSRMRLGATAIRDASEALGREMGRPSRHAVLFVANRLRDLGEADLATALEKAVLRSFNSDEVEHMLFVVSGNYPKSLLATHLKGIEGDQPKRYAIGIWIPDHAQFIRHLYEGL